MSKTQLPAVKPKRRPWNKGRLVGQKRPLLAKQVWAIRARLELAGNLRDLALFNLAIDSKLRGCDLVRLKVTDLVAADGCVSASRLSNAKPIDPCSLRSLKTRAIPSGIGFAALRCVGARFCFPAVSMTDRMCRLGNMRDSSENGCPRSALIQAVTARTRHGVPRRH